MDTPRVHPHPHVDDAVAVHYAGLERLEAPHACYEGLVFIGHLVEGEDGEEVEVFEAVPCRRCADAR